MSCISTPIETFHHHLDLFSHFTSPQISRELKILSACSFVKPSNNKACSSIMVSNLSFTKKYLKCDNLENKVLHLVKGKKKRLSSYLVSFPSLHNIKWFSSLHFAQSHTIYIQFRTGKNCTWILCLISLSYSTFFISVIFFRK